MWLERDPTLLRTDLGKIFIKNLSKEIDTKSLHDKFSVFGNILSCEIILNADNESKGLGFVHFERQESAQTAIDQLDGAILNNKQVFVGHFKSTAEQQKEIGDRTNKFSNLYIRNFGTLIKDDYALRKLFERFGDIITARVFVDEHGQSKGFGFVHFKNPDHAQQAVEAMNGTHIEDRKIFVGRAQKKAERQAQVKQREEALRMERNEHAELGGRAKEFNNVYINNFGTLIKDDREFHQLFERFGEIISARVFVDQQGQSKGFGFVRFKNPDHAQQAVEAMNGTYVGDRRIFVGRAQKKAERQAEVKRREEALRTERNNHAELGNRANKFNNLYISNFGTLIKDDYALRELFERFGDIISTRVFVDEHGQSKGFGFVRFKDPDHAEQAVKAMNGTNVGDRKIFVKRAQKKAERQAEFKLREEALRSERSAEFRGSTSTIQFNLVLTSRTSLVWSSLSRSSINVSNLT